MGACTCGGVLRKGGRGGRDSKVCGASIKYNYGGCLLSHFPCGFQFWQCTLALHVWTIYIVCICTTLTVYTSFDMVPWSILSDLQSVETQLASVGNILNSEHDIGTYVDE